MPRCPWSAGSRSDPSGPPLRLADAPQESRLYLRGLSHARARDRANTAIFSVVHGVLLRPLPYASPDRLLVLNETHPRIGTVGVSYPNFLDWRAQNHVFSGMALMAGVGYNLSGIAQPETIKGQAVSSNFLSLVGVHPLFGRDFDPSENQPGAAPVVMLTYPLWQSHFAGRQDVIGRSVSLDGRAFAIVAVLPPDFRTTDAVSVLEPLGVWLTNNTFATHRANRPYTAAIGRLTWCFSPPSCSCC